MNIDQIMNMIIRQVSRLVINKGVNAGINLASRAGKSKKDMSAEEIERAKHHEKQGNDIKNKAKKREK